MKIMRLMYVNVVRVMSKKVELEDHIKEKKPEITCLAEKT